MLLVPLFLAACGSAHATRKPSSLSSEGAASFPDTAKGMALQEVYGDGLRPARLEPTPFERQLLAKRPLTYADYEEALQATAACTEREVPGVKVSFFRDTLYAYLLGFKLQGGPAPGSSGGYGAGQRALGKCASQYSAQVEAVWFLQNRLSGSAVFAEQVPFLHCVRAAGVTMSAHASLSQIQALFDSRSWAQGLSAVQKQAGDACVSRYARFLSSL